MHVCPWRAGGGEVKNVTLRHRALRDLCQAAVARYHTFLRIAPGPSTTLRLGRGGDRRTQPSVAESAGQGDFDARLALAEHLSHL